ncbi:hypothetical protein JCM33374_g4834 [Metschnikowia sp. JCM 33374]|nr:hypothetical protein JCM33374_g4834 [Metschnikowia sp. JCM 33374]
MAPETPPVPRRRPSGVRKRQSVHPDHRKRLQEHHDSNPNLTQAQLQQWFKDTFQYEIKQSTVSLSLSSKFRKTAGLPGNTESKYKKRPADHPDIEEALFSWIRQDEPSSVKGSKIQEKAKQLWAEFHPDTKAPAFSNGWLCGFRDRYNVGEKSRDSKNIKILRNSSSPIESGAQVDSGDHEDEAKTGSSEDVVEQINDLPQAEEHQEDDDTSCSIILHSHKKAFSHLDWLIRYLEEHNYDKRDVLVFKRIQAEAGQRCKEEAPQ